MQREKNVKVKEVITALCKLLAALGVESVPTAEGFRKAKFNIADAVSDLFLFEFTIGIKSAAQTSLTTPLGLK